MITPWEWFKCRLVVESEKDFEEFLKLFDVSKKDSDGDCISIEFWKIPDDFYIEEYKGKYQISLSYKKRKIDEFDLSILDRIKGFKCIEHDCFDRIGWSGDSDMYYCNSFDLFVSAVVNQMWALKVTPAEVKPYVKEVINEDGSISWFNEKFKNVEPFGYRLWCKLTRDFCDRIDGNVFNKTKWFPQHWNRLRDRDCCISGSVD